MPQAHVAPAGMRKVVTVLNNAEYASLKEYAERKELSIYGILKTALREYLKRHP